MRIILVAILVNICILLNVSMADQNQSCSTLLDRSWRGINCFHCMYPTVPGGASPIARILKQSCLKRVMISFVVDGSFGWNYTDIIQSLETLRANGQEVWLHLYVFNGPAQRRWQSKIFKSFAVMDPSEFKVRIVHDRRLRSEFSKIVQQRIAPLVRYAEINGIKVSIAPGLEDNLDNRAFKAALQLLRKNLPRENRVQYVRNPCYRCVLGSDRSLPGNLILEEHDDLQYHRLWNSIINTDGRYFRFTSEDSSLPTLRDLASSWLKSPSSRGNLFLLWIPHLQDAPYGVVTKPLPERHFRLPTEEEVIEIIDFLQQ